MVESMRHSLFDLFKSIFDIEQKTGEVVEYDAVVFTRIINKIKQIHPSICFTDEDERELRKKADAYFEIYQPEGVLLLSEYEHVRDWYDVIEPSLNQYYWTRYRSFLFSRDWSPKVLQSMEKCTLNVLMNNLGDPAVAESFSRKGLVMGDVQSGKTSNYIGLICKAADAGYRVIILLTGITEQLRRQTQERVEEGFIGWDIGNQKWVGVGLSSRDGHIPKSATSRATDFTGNAGDNTYLQFKSEPAPYIFITKKNPTTLKKIRESIAKINIIPPMHQIDESLLIIDDEADNASVNTNDASYDPTRINMEIRKILALFTRANYVGFTATPFANVFIDPDSETEMLQDDLFPKDFIMALPPPSNYIGAERIFMKKDLNILQVISDADGSFPVKHTIDWRGHTLFGSLKEAINAFFLTNGIRDIREKDQRNSHRSMMINVSRFINVQNRIEQLVETYVESLTNAIEQCRMLPYDQYIKNGLVDSLHGCYLKHFSSCVDWTSLFPDLFESIKDIKVLKVPSKDKDKQLDYSKHKEHGLRVIVVGGLALSRGLTLEGLSTSYLYRNTATFDVLMQMGRWFGYRNKPEDYSDLCRVWMLDDTRKFFTTITRSVKELKDDFMRMKESKLPPRDFGIRVRNESEELGITSPNKMRHTRMYFYASDFNGRVFETPFIDSEVESLENNMKLVSDLLHRHAFRRIDGQMICTGVPVDVVASMLAAASIHDANQITYFDTRSILEFMKDAHFDVFDVLLISGNGEPWIAEGVTIATSERSFDMIDDKTLRISGSHRRLGGKNDTKYGLDADLVKQLDRDGSSNRTFMIEGRNPLLIIYPLTLKRSEDEHDEMTRLRLDGAHLVPIGFGIGFPADSSRSTMTAKYAINTGTEWRKLMNRKDDDSDEPI